ncbi:hypothetical protein BDU57DRAFT_509395 [Ampelomyces quisqualis]|uniref:Uncharacterized protein n=1 Tax=Ampelomyces quisqualis TaxID=50730 RepID=A0A6A5R0C0_AMPQU|nr:hypothetical protein BDU57DRAFT_509395 [Ampelomyces quisqualis]
MLVGHMGNHQRLRRFARHPSPHTCCQTQSPKLCPGRPRCLSAKRRQAWLVGPMTEMTGAAKLRAEFSCPPRLVEVGAAVGLMLARVFTTRRQNMRPSRIKSTEYALPTRGCRLDPSHRAAGNERVLSSAVVRDLALDAVPRRIMAQQQCSCKRHPAGTE